MGRPPRPIGANVTYHLMNRGNRGTLIFSDDADREVFLRLLGKVCSRYGWSCLAYCLMGNHFHLAATTTEANVHRGMAQLVGHYAREYNRRHGLADHLFGRRYTEVVLTSDAHLLTVIRYIARNPVRSGLTERPEDWPWSSYPALLGNDDPTPFFVPSAVLNLLDNDVARARVTLRQLVDEEWATDAPARARSLREVA